ncbi:MAG TPA: AcvB/VirJ family lysyl-phosphatidylglycerol hydrolase [Geminicoccus sp.]|uniref:virulence factor family protein n=1 Tax=Geminicoccus sp. TaxID=2024832 RepID=UPI002B9F1C9C|nr:AcvB/VirJ family lysyl-phosphatidylglycerol hydrolase [Geminicoccus sp.]HWL69519.1 AcvB/VirJ family lysyl-phosphatidylglycerol hydrolase [Geminicoccus sp.]
MAWFPIWFLLALLAVAAGPKPLLATEPVAPASGSRLGTLHVAAPAGETRAILFLVSDLDGWNEPMEQAATRLSAAGHGVIGIDLATWLDALAADPADTDCHYLVGDLEAAGKLMQRTWRSSRYQLGIVAGLGAGGTLAAAALANAPPATLAGAVALDRAERVRSRLPFCPAGAAGGDAAGGFAYPPPIQQDGWLVDARWHAADPAASWPPMARSASVTLDPRNDLGTALARAIDAGLVLWAPPGDEGAPLADLPLVELPAEGPGHTFALVLSGDGGWRDLDKSIADYFVAHGLPTLGLDSLRYFWKARQPAEVAGDLDRIVRHYRRQWGKDRVALVGYSFGADVLPAVWPLLAPQTQAAITQVSLLALGVSADFEFHLTDWVGWASPDARPIPPDLARMDRSRVQCFFGADEPADETGCRSAEANGAELVERPGGHHFDGDYAAIAARILAGLGQRSGGTW